MSDKVPLQQRSERPTVRVSVRFANSPQFPGFPPGTAYMVGELDERTGIVKCDHKGGRVGLSVHSTAVLGWTYL